MVLSKSSRTLETFSSPLAIWCCNLVIFNSGFSMAGWQSVQVIPRALWTSWLRRSFQEKPRFLASEMPWQKLQFSEGGG